MNRREPIDISGMLRWQKPKMIMRKPGSPRPRSLISASGIKHKRTRSPMAKGVFGGFDPYRKDLSDTYKQFFQKKRGLLRFKKKGKAKKVSSVYQGEEVFNEWIRSARAGYPCEDDAILAGEPLCKPSSQICPHF